MTEGKDLLAVQTLRNWVMASSFLASTAILIALGAVSAVFRSHNLMQISETFSLVHTGNETVVMFKLIVLAVNFFAGFFNFALSIRYYNHASFIINIPSSSDPSVDSGYVAKVINNGTTHYRLGMRTYYLSVPFALWLFGPVWLLLGSIAIVVILNRLDRTV